MEAEKEGGGAEGREGILIRFGPYHRDNRAGAGARCLRAAVPTEIESIDAV